MITRFVPQTASFSNSFYENLHDIYNLKDILIKEELIDYKAISHSIHGKTNSSILPLRN